VDGRDYGLIKMLPWKEQINTTRKRVMTVSLLAKIQTQNL